MRLLKWGQTIQTQVQSTNTYLLHTCPLPTKQHHKLHFRNPDQKKKKVISTVVLKVFLNFFCYVYQICADRSVKFKNLNYNCVPAGITLVSPPVGSYSKYRLHILIPFFGT